MVRCNVACTWAVVSTSLARARRRASTPLANSCIPERTSSCCDETPRSADDTSANAFCVSALVGESTGTVGAASTSVDCTVIVVAALPPRGSTKIDCCVGAASASIDSLGKGGKTGHGGSPDGA